MSGGVEEAAPAGAAERKEHRLHSDRSGRARRVLAPVRVAALRIARRPTRTAVVAAGVALATATLVGVFSGSLVMRDRVLHQQLAAVPPAQRAFRVDAFGLASSSSSSAARAATQALGLVTSGAPVRTVAFRALRFQTHLAVLSAVTGAEHWIRLRSGRLPGPCRPAHCEMLVIGSARLPGELTTRGLRVVLVGRASLKVPSILGSFAQPPDATLLVSSDVPGLSSPAVLQSNFRTESWVAPFEPGDIRVWDVDPLLDRAARAQSFLERRNPALRLTAPDDALLAAQRQGRIGTRRLLLVGGEIAGLLLGFAVLAAVGLRRTILPEWRRFEQGGARRSQLWLLVATETGVAAFAGAVVGAAVGAGAAGWVSDRAGVGAEALFSHAVLTPGTALIVLLAWVVATAVLVGSVRSPAGTRAGPVRIADVIALGALTAAIVAASRGGAGADTLADDSGSITLLLLFPGLLCLAAALIAARALAPLLRLAERGVRRSRPSIRLAVLALARAPSRTAVAVSFLVVSLGLALLAAGYRATLERGVRDEAAYQVPLDYALTEETPLVGPLDAASLARYESIAPGVEAYPVLRRFGDVPSVGTQFTSPVVLGLDPKAVAGVHGWRSDFGGPPPERLARLLGAQGAVRLAGPALPPGTTGFRLAAQQRGAEVDLDVEIAKPSGEIVSVPLVTAGSPRFLGRVRVPSRGRVVALTLALTRRAAAALAHREALHSIGGQGPEGSLELGPLVAFSGARRLGVVTTWRGWVGRSGARHVPGARTTVRYALTEAQTAVFRPREPTDGHPLLLVTSPDVARSAGPGGIVTLELGDQHVTGRVVAVAKRFPGTADGGGSFVIAEESHLQTALDADAPRTGWPIEVWLSVPSRATDRRAEAALGRAPFSALVVDSRRGLEQRLRSDPLSRAVEIALVVGALIALALAVCGLWLIVLGDVADERGDLYDLEAQGITPGELRGQLRLRAAILGALGVAGGLGLGLVLSGEVVRLVQVSASGVAPVPPLVREVGWEPAGLGLAGFLVLGAALIEVTLRRAFREDTPRRSGEME